MMKLDQQRHQLLKQAIELRDHVRHDLSLSQFGSDDLRMKTYNDLIAAAANLFSQDPVLNGRMVSMPDANLQTFGTLLPVTAMPPRLPSERLESRVTHLINRLELLLAPSQETLQPKGGSTEPLPHTAVPTQNKPNQNPVPPKEQVFPAGTPLDAYKAFKDVVQSAQKSILLVDNFVDGDIVELLLSAKKVVVIRVLTRQIQGDFRAQAKRFQQQRLRDPKAGILEVRVSDEIHDRYLVLDDAAVLHVGASIKDAGQKMSSFVEHQDQIIKRAVISALEEHWNKARKVEL